MNLVCILHTINVNRALWKWKWNLFIMNNCSFAFFKATALSFELKKMYQFTNYVKRERQTIFVYLTDQSDKSSELADECEGEWGIMWFPFFSVYLSFCLSVCLFVRNKNFAHSFQQSFIAGAWNFNTLYLGMGFIFVPIGDKLLVYFILNLQTNFGQRFSATIFSNY